MLKILIAFSLLLSGCLQRQCPEPEPEKESGLLVNTYQAQIEDREQEIRNLTNRVERLSKDIEYWQSVGDEWREKYFSQNCSSQFE